ncbi:replication protein A 32 kDa subunit A-like isoform X4 [Tasmannia lanceolata]|uniref:replication protein A 32 kDa subunit A-like isoform X4 n=1 Tax=Tasmannia lanceolata TaxID=3420 RepID=UPI0040639430
MFASQFDGNTLFSGGGFMPSQSTQNADLGFSPAKSRINQCLLPLTVKQISETYQSDDKSNFVIDDIEVNNVTLLGMVSNKVEKVTDVSFSLDDGTGRVEVHRWTNDSAESNEVAVIQPVTDYDEVAYHFIQCIHAHLCNKRLQGGAPTQSQTNSVTTSPYQNGSNGLQNSVSNQFSVDKGMDKSSDFDQMVLATFLEPNAIAEESGLHVDEIAKRLGVPKNKVMESINYHIDMGNIYSTIDDDHFKSTRDG